MKALYGRILKKLKKVSLLILLFVVLSPVLMAAIPTKIMRLTIINKSGYNVNIQLKGSTATNAFYYLTIPAGTRDEPMVKVFTIMSDAYNRTTWQCDGLRSRGALTVDGNIRLTFMPCGDFACRGRTTVHLEWRDCNKDPVWVFGSNVHQGEPFMEKVAYFRYVYHGIAKWSSPTQYNGAVNIGRFSWYWRRGTYQLPSACWFRYRY